MEYIQAARREGEYSDFTVQCRGRTWKVHSVVVCPRVRAFKEAYNRWERTTECFVDISSEDPDAVAAMLDSIYGVGYQVPQTNPPTSSARFHASVFKLAKTCEVTEFGDLAYSKFRAAIANCWHTGAFALMVEDVFKETPTMDVQLRDTIKDVAMQHATELLLHDQYKHFQDVVAAIPALSFELARQIARAQPQRSLPPRVQANSARPAGTAEEAAFVCPSCQCHFTATMPPDMEEYEHDCQRTRDGSTRNKYSVMEWMQDHREPPEYRSV